MFERQVESLGAAALRSLLSLLATPPAADASTDLIEQIALLEQVKGACAARQAWLSVSFDEEQRARQLASGTPSAKIGRGVAEQIALARRESPTHGDRHLGLAKALVREMPRTFAALSSGQISEWSATVLARETACLAADDRRLVDAELGDRLTALGPARLRREAWAAACRLDPVAAVARHRRAVGDRRVSLRPAPDAMTHLSALLPVTDGVAVYAALTAAVGAATSSGDPRGRGQIMADTLVDRLTQPASSSAGLPGGSADVPTVEVCLVMASTTLLGGGDEPALVTTTDASASNSAADLVPAPIARELVATAARVALRRLVIAPDSGRLVAMESRRRVFDGNLRRLLVLRDATCRTPWCDAPLRHVDHVEPHASGGVTSLDNAQGLCERCHRAKSLPGWRARVLGTGDAEPPTSHVVRTTTPAGRAYDSTAPPLLSHPLPVPERRAG